MIYVLEVYDRASAQEPIAYTVENTSDLIRRFDDKFEGEPYTLEVVGDITYARRHYDGERVDFEDIDELEEWVAYIYDEYGVTAHIYESLEEVKQELDNPGGLYFNAPAWIRLHDLYTNNKEG